MSQLAFQWIENRSQPTIDSIVSTVHTLVQNLSNTEVNEPTVSATISTSQETTTVSNYNEEKSLFSTVSNAISTVTSDITNATIKIDEDDNTTSFENASSIITTESIIESTYSGSTFPDISTAASNLNDSILGATKFTSQNLTNVFPTEQIDVTSSTSLSLDEITNSQSSDFTTQSTTIIENITLQIDNFSTTITNNITDVNEAPYVKNDTIYIIIGAVLLISIIVIVSCYILCRKCKKNYRTSGDYYVTQLADYSQSNGKSQSDLNNAKV